MNIVVIGAGNMGGALIKGWAKVARESRNSEEAEMTLNISATAHTQKTLDALTVSFPDVTTSLDNRAAVAAADVVVLAVKPWLIDEVCAEIADLVKEKLVISVAANAKNDLINVYAMPNIAAEFGESMTFVLKDGDEHAVRTAEYLFALVGKVMVVDAKSMSAGNMMAGCGIAYVMRFIRAMMEGGVEMGLYPNVAKEIAMQTMQGAVTLLGETGLHPEAAIDKVTTPGGLTIKGLNELDHAGFNSAVVRCLKAGLK